MRKKGEEWEEVEEEEEEKTIKKSPLDFTDLKGLFLSRLTEDEVAAMNPTHHFSLFLR